MESISALSLPPGFGFHPTDVELISHYLARKIVGLKIDSEVIPEVDIYKYEPWDLPAKCQIPTRDSKWHFFTSRDRKYPNGSRSNRATEAGYWKSTGKDRSIRSHNQVIGTKKTLVFYEGRPPCGKRTDWIMHEYYMDENKRKVSPSVMGTFVLCRVTKRDGLAFDDEIVDLGTEDILTRPKPPKDVTMPMVVNKGSLSSSGNADDFEAWCEKELYDPNIFDVNEILKLKDEPEISQQDFNSLALKQEPIDLLPEFSEGLQFLQPEGDGTYSILQDSEDLSYDVLGEFKIEKWKSKLSDENDADSATFDSFASEELHDDDYPLVNILKRRIIMPSEQFQGSNVCKLQVHKMNSSGRSRHEIVKLVNQNHNLDRNDAIQQPAGTEADAGKCPSVLSLCQSNVESKHCLDYEVGRSSLSFGTASNMTPMRRSLFLFDSALECFFLGGCMLGITALFLYVLLQHEMPFWSGK